MKVEEIVCLPDFRRGMTFKSQASIGLGHTMAIVDDLNAGPPCIDDNNMDMAGTGINSVLNQLLNNRSRSLNDLASSYLIGDGIREEADNVH